MTVCCLLPVMVMRVPPPASQLMVAGGLLVQPATDETTGAATKATHTQHPQQPRRGDEKEAGIRTIIGPGAEAHAVVAARHINAAHPSANQPEHARRRQEPLR